MRTTKHKKHLSPLLHDNVVIGIQGKTLGVGDGENITPFYCLKPGQIKISIGNPVFHGLPRNPHKIKRITESAEYRVYEEVYNDFLPENFKVNKFLLKEKSPAGKKYRANYFRLRGIALAKTNGLLAKSLAVADMNAVKLARRFKDASALIYKFSAENLRIKQLIEVFPYLGFKVCKKTEYAKFALEKNDYDKYHEALKMIDAGTKLKHIADVCGVPMSLRKIKPQAVHLIVAPIADELIHSYLPRTTMEQYRLFSVIYQVHRRDLNHDPNITTWLFKNFNTKLKFSDSLTGLYDLLDYVTATELHGAKRFNPNMNFASVKEASDDWHRRIAVSRSFDGMDPNTIFPEPWLPPYSNGKFKIEPITTVKDLVEEGLKMKHCVSSYGKRVLRGDCYIYTVFENEQKVATLEIDKRTMLAPEYVDNETVKKQTIRIAQLRGPCNQKVSPELRSKVMNWFIDSVNPTGVWHEQLL